MLACVFTCTSAIAQELGLDLSETSEVTSALVLPPVVRVAATQGGFVGFDARKTIERMDSAGHKRLVAAFTHELQGKVVPAEATMGFLNKQGVIAAQLKVAGVIAALAKAAHVDWVIGFELNRTGALVGTIYDASGTPTGEPSYVNNGASLSQRVSDDMAVFVRKQLGDIARKRAEVAAKAKPPPPAPVVLPPPPEDEVDPELAAKVVAKAWTPDPRRVRAVVTVGPGAALRGLDLGGGGASALAEVKNNGVVGLGVYVALKPLELFEGTAGQRLSDLELSVHYRHAFVRAVGSAGSVVGEDCTMNDDDVQARLSWRIRLGDNPMLPRIGLAGGWSNESTIFACNLPVISTTWRGVDAQLRVRQPLWADKLALDLSVGPRFLIAGPDASNPGFSMSGEAWLEATPVSVLFVRAGARVSRLAAATPTLSVVDLRSFFALEVGAFF